MKRISLLTLHPGWTLVKLNKPNSEDDPEYLPASEVSSDEESSNIFSDNEDWLAENTSSSYDDNDSNVDDENTVNFFDIDFPDTDEGPEFQPQNEDVLLDDECSSQISDSLNRRQSALNLQVASIGCSILIPHADQSERKQ